MDTLIVTETIKKRLTVIAATLAGVDASRRAGGLTVHEREVHERAAEALQQQAQGVRDLANSLSDTLSPKIRTDFLRACGCSNRRRHQS